MVRLLITAIFFLFFNYSVNAESLNKSEMQIFNFIDFNKDKNINFEEVSQSLKLIFQIIDEDRDGNISLNEIQELKNLIESMI